MNKSTYYEIKENNEYNSREVYFSGKPSAEVRDALKALKMRWNGCKRCWYGYTSERDILNAITGTAAADDLQKYCFRFIDWVKKNPERFLVEKHMVFAFDETDFIEYINSRFFSTEPSVYVKALNLADVSYKDWPKEYEKMPWLNF